MASRDNTLMSKLGFQDPDRKEPMHDLACEFLSIPENMRKILDIASPSEKALSLALKSAGLADTAANRAEHTSQYSILPQTEVAIGAPYVAGFMDVMGVCEHTVWRKGCIVVCDRSLICIEVKISPCQTGDLIRQINMYRAKLGYVNHYHHWFLAVPRGYKLPPADLLARESIKTISLGERFEQWVAQRQQSTTTDIEL